jgi:fumarylpyruvate hydrolase
VTVPRFNKYLGIEVDRTSNGESEAHLDLGPHHLNRRGVVHGGVIAALLDTALGTAVISSIPKEWWCATISLSVQFLEAVHEGRVTARGRVLRKGRRVAFAGGEVHDAAGRLVASAQGSLHLWPYRPEMERPVSEPFVVARGTGERIRVGKILAVGRNYADHTREMGWKEAAPPVLFLKPPSAIVHDGGTVRIPRDVGEVHHEVELVVVIGTPGRAIPQEAALEHVLGYAVGLDMTLRDLQSAAKAKGEPWALSKGFDTSAPVSLVAPRGEVGDGSGLALSLDVNGSRRQETDTSAMIHGVAAIVSFASRLITLDRGDLIFTGTPAGVGPVRPGDRLEASLDRVGTLAVRVE